MKAYLVLEDGSIYEGEVIGKEGTTYGEVVFNTSMTGYQEMLTDPSYCGQILTFTYPLIGNYGINEDDFESDSIKVEGVIVKELCEKPSNWQCKKTLQQYLQENNITGIQGIDTRALTKKLRVYGVMMGAISTVYKPDELFERLKKVTNYDKIDFVKKVTTKQAYEWQTTDYELPTTDLKIVVIDYGVKYNILRILSSYRLKIKVLPATVKIDEILKERPNGIVLSPGPGNPANLYYAINTIKELINLAIPIMGICLGHQLLALAGGCETFKLKFGHRGANHPVKDLTTNKCYITSQNHGYAVEKDSVKNSEFEITHINLNDNTIEGMQHKKLPIFSIQYHPEASPGPQENKYLFDKFVKLVIGT